MPGFGATLRVCGSIIVGYLTPRELLTVRGCTRALRREYDPRTNRLAWELVRPEHDDLGRHYAAAASLSTVRLMVYAYGLDVGSAVDWALLECACARGDLATAQWLVRRCGLGAGDAVGAGDYYDAMWHACAYGHLSVACWLAETFDVTTAQVRKNDNHVLVAACENGHRDIVVWLMRSFGLGAADIGESGALWGACRYGHLPVVEWLVLWFRLPFHRSFREGSFATACIHNHIGVVQWCVRHFGMPAEYVTTHMGGVLLNIRTHSFDPSVLRWLVEHFALTYEDVGGEHHGAAATQPVMEAWIAGHFSRGASRPAGAGPPAGPGTGT